MPQPVVCPCCQGSLEPMPILSDLSIVDYFHCATCGHISERPKGLQVMPTPLTSALSLKIVRR